MNPLNVGITDPEIRHQRIETVATSAQIVELYYLPHVQ